MPNCFNTQVTFRQIREKFIAIAMYRNCYWAQTKSGKGQLLLRSLMHENRFPVPAWTEPRGRPDVHVGHCSTSINNAEHGSTHMNMSDTISGSSPASDRLNCSNVPTPCTPDGSELQQRTLVTGRKAREQAASEFVQNFLEVSVISKRLIALGVCMHDVTESWLKNAKVTPRQPAPHASLRRSADDTSSAVFVGHIPFAKPLPESPVAVYNTGSDPRALLRLYDSTLGRMRFEDRQLVRIVGNARLPLLEKCASSTLQAHHAAMLNILARFKNYTIEFCRSVLFRSTRTLASSHLSTSMTSDILRQPLQLG